MNKEKLISIALLVVMLLGCILPSVKVNAATNDVVQLNSNLFNAIVKELDAQKIVYTKDSISKKITISETELAKVKALDLNESNISDLTGIDFFKYVEHLDLSGNNLTSDSGLELLNNLPKLNYLDLSTNRIDSLATIDTLVKNLKATGTIVVSGQTISVVRTAYVDVKETSNNEVTAIFDLPQILQYAGAIKSCWKTVTNVAEGFGAAPIIKDMPIQVTPSNSLMTVEIADKNGRAKPGVVALEIYINDDATEAQSASNFNKAANNLLNGSRINFYVVVTSNTNEAITTPDTNLYNAVKSQLTYGQMENKDLESFPYVVSANGEIEYYELNYFDLGQAYVLDGGEYFYYPATKSVYKKVNTYVDPSFDEYVQYIPSADGKVENSELRIADFNGNNMVIAAMFYTNDAKIVESHSADESGYVSTYAKVRFPKQRFVTDPLYLGLVNNNLYVRAYDIAKTFVIEDSVLTNKITSLILNNKEIYDLEGIQYFVGITSNLNVSHNYLESIDSLCELQEQKDNWEKQLQAAVEYWLRTREFGNINKSFEEVKTSKEALENYQELVEKTTRIIINNLAKAGNLDPASENYNDQVLAVVKTINTELDKVYGFIDENGEEVEGYLELIEETSDELSDSLRDLYSLIASAYEEYNNLYKLATILTDTMNYQTIEEYEMYQEKISGTRENALAVLNEELDYLEEINNKYSLGELDNELLYVTFSDTVSFEKHEELGLVGCIREYVEKTPLNRLQIVDMLNKIRKIAIYSQAESYCMMQRRFNLVDEETCYIAEYIQLLVNELELENIPCEIEKDCLNFVKQYTKEDNSLIELEDGHNYNNIDLTVYIYANYMGIEIPELSEMIFVCKGEYEKATGIAYVTEAYEDRDTLFAEVMVRCEGNNVNETAISDVIDRINVSKIIKYGFLKEVVFGDITEEYIDEFPLIQQLMSFTSKILTANVERYVVVPDLKVLNCSYNNTLSDIEEITKLKSLVELDASNCFVADVTNIDWAKLEKLRVLKLGYNFIQDMGTILDLKRLTELDLRKNLISGKLKISPEQYQTIFKNLKTLNLSENKIEDINDLLVYLDYVTGGNYANYLALEDTLNVDLRKQSIEIIVSEPISLQENPRTVNIEMPKIITQLLAIDTNRTSFGTSSDEGRITSEGTYVTLNTVTTGDKVAYVYIEPGNGAYEVKDCIGNETKVTIKYKVVNRVVSNVTVTPNTAVKVETGKTQQFTAKVTGENLKYNSVKWSVEGNNSQKTVITNDGLLTIGDDETSPKVSVSAISNDDASKKVTIEVTVVAAEKPADKPANPADKPADKPADEPAEKPQEPAEKPAEKPQEPAEKPADTKDDPLAITTGYKTKDKVVYEVKTKTPVKDFADTYLANTNYKVVVKDASGNVVTTGFVKTGMTVEIQDKNGVVVEDKTTNKPMKYTVAVRGDVNGDGLSTSLDTTLIKAYRNDVISFTPAQEQAADVNYSGKVTILDTKLLLYHRAGVEGYSLDYSK